MGTRAFVLVLLLALSGIAAAQYKCSEKGKVVYQDHACEPGSSVEKMKVNAPPEPTSSADASMQVAHMKHRADAMQALRLATEQGRPLVGMTSAELEMSMGRPTSVNASANRNGSSEQRIYERAGRTFYVYTDTQGSVTAFQDQTSLGSLKAKASTR